LGWNKLSTIPSGLFQNLAKLETLRLQNNTLRSLDRNVFQGLTSLKYLNLNVNNLRMLPPGIFNGLTSLTVIYASENQLEEIPESLFRGLNSLYRIDLNDNLLSSLAASTFCGLSSLHMLFLYRNRVNFNEASWLSSRSNACPIYTCSWASPYPGQYSLQVHPLYSQTHISLSCLENAPIPADAEYIFFNLDNPNLTKKPSISFPSNMLNGLRNLTYFYVGKINVFDFPYQLFWEATSLELIYIQESTIYPDLPWFMVFLN
jgi:Leucine-rich repeat (LRR) protein